jgi:dipeptidyl aminopeptidase/acylaminoacyl peptidase
MKKMRAVALAWAGMVAGLGTGAAQTAATAGKADSSATLRNDKQIALRNDKQKTAGDKQNAGVGAAAVASAKRAMTFADLMAMKRVSDPQVSPSGKWVMFSVTEVSLEKNTKVNHLWVVPIDGSAPERQITFGDGETFGRFSPDGKWVSMSMKDQIYLAPWDEAAGKVGDAHAVTSVVGGADGAIWSPDSKRLMFTTQVYPECSVKGGKTNAGVPPLRFAPVGMTQYGDAGAESATWAEEDACDRAKDEAAAASPVKAQVWDALLYRHWDQYTGLKRSHILVVDADGGGSSKSNDGVRDLTPASAVGDAETPTWMLGGPLEYAWAPDGKEIAYVTNLDAVPAASTNNDVFTLRLDEPGAKAVKMSTSLGSDDEPEYSPDGRWLAFRSQKQAGFESDRFRLMLFDREKKTIKELMPKFDGWVDEFVWATDSQFLYFASSNNGHEPILTASTDIPDLLSYVTSDIGWGGPAGLGETTLVPGGGIYQRQPIGEYGALNLSKDGKTLVAVLGSASQPGEVITINKAGGNRFNPLNQAPRFANAGVKITSLSDGLIDKLDMAQLEPFWFTGAEGTKVEGFLLRPPGFDAGKKYPVKFVMHGGPQTALGDSWSYRWNWELLAASGYVVVGINRRGSTGYGQKFVDEVSGDWGGRAYEDLMKGLDYAEATYPFIDKTRECALGASYGGFMADWVLTHTNRFKCIVTHDGMVDPVSAYGTTEEMWFNEWEFRRPEDFPKGWDGFSAGYDPMGRSGSTNAGVPPLRPSASGRDDGGLGGGHAAEPWRYQSLAADQDPFRKWSALRAIENAKTPTLIIHSQRDYRLDVSQGFELYTALERRGVPARFLYFPDEGHWVLKPQNSQLWYETVGDWCDRWTKTGKYSETGK